MRRSIGHRTFRQSLVAAAALLGACSSSDPPEEAACSVPGAPFVSAHRGGAAYAPENTMAAFRNALRLGADELEMDTQLSADGELIVLHDDTLDRTTNCSGTVGAMTLQQIRACDAAYWFSPGQPTTVPAQDVEHPLRGQGIAVPTLREVLDWHASLRCAPRLSIEIKNIPGESNFDVLGTRIATVLVPLLQQYGLADQAIVQSFWPASLSAVKNMEPRLKTQFLTTSSLATTAIANLTIAISTGQDIVAPNFDAPDFNAALVELAHGAGKQVVPYTVDRSSDIARIAGFDIDGLITNFPACVQRTLDHAAVAVATPDGVPEVDACPAEPAAITAKVFERPSADACAALRPARWAPASGHEDPDARLRVFALQYKQEIRHVESHQRFRTKMRCLMEEHVVPSMTPGLPTLVVYNEDAGLMTIASGSRGALVRLQAQTPLRAPLGDAVPLGIVGALGLLNVAYLPQVLAYQLRFPLVDPRKQVFLAATDTFARVFSQTFSDIARDYGVYVVASNNQAPYAASRDPLDIALFRDPDLGAVDEVYVATSSHIANVTFLWGPNDLHPDAPRGQTNLLFTNEKVPLTDIETTVLGLDEGPASGDAALANAAGYEVEGFRLGFATSLPAFRWGYDFDQRPADLQPCADVRASYMPCMDALGVEVVIQAEANPGRWAANVAGGWQPLEWMDSTWRSVAEPSVRFRYNVTAHLVGNLLDLPFDGQSAITARNGAAGPAHYIGNLEFDDSVDREAYRDYVGDKTEFIALAPWISDDVSRAVLAAKAAALSPGSGDALENDFLETAVWADLVR